MYLVPVRVFLRVSNYTYAAMQKVAGEEGGRSRSRVRSPRSVRHASPSPFCASGLVGDVLRASVDFVEVGSVSRTRFVTAVHDHTWHREALKGIWQQPVSGNSPA